MDSLRKLVESISLREFIYFESILTVTSYIIMIEGLGKGVKYSLFVANAIIFVSVQWNGGYECR